MLFVTLTHVLRSMNYLYILCIIPDEIMHKIAELTVYFLFSINHRVRELRLNNGFFNGNGTCGMFCIHDFFSPFLRISS